MAEQVGNLSIATRNLEGVGRTLGAYQDMVSITVDARREFSKQEMDEARRLARVLILDENNDVIDVGATPWAKIEK